MYTRWRVNNEWDCLLSDKDKISECLSELSRPKRAKGGYRYRRTE